MAIDLDDVGGARDLAMHRISVAKDDLKAAKLNFENGYYSRKLFNVSSLNGVKE